MANVTNCIYYLFINLLLLTPVRTQVPTAHNGTNIYNIVRYRIT